MMTLRHPSSESDDDDSDSSDEYDDDEPDPANYQPEPADNVADPVHYDEVDRERMLDMQNPTGPYETVEPDDLYAEQPIATEPLHRYSTRSRDSWTL